MPSAESLVPVPFETRDLELFRQAHDRISTKLLASIAAQLQATIINEPHESVDLAEQIAQLAGFDPIRFRRFWTIVRMLDNFAKLASDPRKQVA